MAHNMYIEVFHGKYLNTFMSHYIKYKTPPIGNLQK